MDATKEARELCRIISEAPVVDRLDDIAAFLTVLVERERAGVVWADKNKQEDYRMSDTDYEKDANNLLNQVGGPLAKLLGELSRRPAPTSGEGLSEEEKGALKQADSVEIWSHPAMRNREDALRILAALVRRLLSRPEKI